MIKSKLIKIQRDRKIERKSERARELVMDGLAKSWCKFCGPHILLKPKNEQNTQKQLTKFQVY